MMKRWKTEVLCVQETKWRGDRARKMAEEYKMLHAGGDGRSNGVGIIVNVEISKEVVREDHCSMDDDSPTDGMCHLRLRTQTGRTEAEKEAFRKEVESLAGLSDVQTDAVRCGRFQCAHRCG